MINFTVYGDPVPKGRPRFFRRGKFIGTYSDKKTKTGENDFKSQAVKYRPKAPLAYSVIVEIDVYRKMPKAFSRTKVAHAESGFIRPTTKPDVDNYAKLVLDAMNGIFFHDDSQVVSLKCTKNYSARPRITITLTEV